MLDSVLVRTASRGRGVACVPFPSGQVRVACTAMPSPRWPERFAPKRLQACPCKGGGLRLDAPSPPRPPLFGIVSHFNRLS